VVDFTCNGVFKIIWFLVYAPAYVVCAVCIHTYLTHKDRLHYARAVIASFFGGILIGHFFFMGRHTSETISMKTVSVSPLVFRAEPWTEELYVSSAKIQQKNLKPDDSVSVELIYTIDFGCIRFFKIVSVGGINILTDPDSTWTWKTPHGLGAVKTSGPKDEDQSLPWCRFRFY
jgi:hypothetical protein